MSLKNDTIYSLLIEDAQYVAQDTIDRELTVQELEVLEAAIPDFIDWQDAISTALSVKGIE